MPVPSKEPGNRLSRWWKGLSGFTKSSFVAGLTVLLTILLLSVVVAVQEDVQFAIGVIVGAQDPYEADSDLAPVALSLTNILLVPVLVGGAIGAAIGLASSKPPPRAPTALEDVITERDERFGRYDKPTPESQTREDGTNK